MADAWYQQQTTRLLRWKSNSDESMGERRSQNRMKVSINQMIEVAKSAGLRSGAWSTHCNQMAAAIIQ